MSEPDRFLTRWSRRKRAATREVTRTEVPKTEPAKTEPAKPPSGKRDVTPGDPAYTAPAATPAAARTAEGGPVGEPSLPPIESIEAGTDIRGFLAQEVAPDLARAALRRAWLTDPAIRDFVGLADYDWDFNAPDSMAGFGPLRKSDDVHQLLAHMLGDDSMPQQPTGLGEADPNQGMQAAAHLPAADCHDEPLSTDSDKQTAEPRLDGTPNATHAPATDQESSGRVAAPQNFQTIAATTGPVGRRHGRALPE
jgi:hypothetical protein